MPNTVIALKKSAVAANVPSSLANGELAINFADSILFFRHANGSIASIASGRTISFGTVNAAGTLLLADQVNDVLDIRAGQNIIITGDAVNDRMTINADLTAANSWANTKLNNSTVTLAGSLTTTGQVTANGVVTITPVGGQEGGEIQLQATGSNTNWTIDSYQNNIRIFASSGTSVSNLNFFHAIGGGSTRIGVNRADPGYTLDVNGIVNASAIYVNGSPISTGGSMDYPFANGVANSANAYAVTVGAAANTWANGLSTIDRAIANSAANSSNAYTVTVGAAGNTYAIVYANGVANSANAYAVTVGAAANTFANTKLANTSGVSFAGDLYFPTGNIGVGSGSSAGYRLYVNGSFAANTKSFVIDHPTKSGMTLRHGSLEGPENGVYVRGRVQGKVIELPDYWVGLVDEDTITVQLTAIGHSQNPYVVEVSNNNVFIDTENHTEPYCFFTIYGERKDVEKLVVEY